MVVAASNKEDHRYADSFGWHRSWQDDVSPGSAWRSRQGAGAEEVHATAAADLYRKHADIADRAGSMFRSAFSRTRVAEARPRRAIDCSPVCEAVREVQQERLRGCRGDRRSGGTQEHALRPDQDR